MIAFLGTGLLGANFVRALLERGETVHVWNRTHDKAKALEDAGAVAFENPADAVRGATRVHITLPDDAVVNDVLERAKSALSHDTIIVDHTTTLPSLTGQRAKRWADAGIGYLHAPVFMGPSNARAATGTMMASGERALFDAVAPALEKMTGKLVYLGEDPTRAAAVKLLGNHFLVVLNAGLGDTLLLAKAMGLSADSVTGLFDFFNPGAMIPARLRRVLEADYGNPTWTLQMARKDVRLMLESAAAGGEVLTTVGAIAQQMDGLIAEGHGDEDYSVMAKRAVVG